MTERQQDQKWVDDTRAEYLRRTEPKPVGFGISMAHLRAPREASENKARARLLAVLAPIGQGLRRG